LTREQEVEICKRIEEAESHMKRLVYSLGFTAKEHIAIAEKLLSEPPKERSTASWSIRKSPIAKAHLRELRHLIKKVRTLDALVMRNTWPAKNWRRLAAVKRLVWRCRNWTRSCRHVPEILLQAKGAGGHDRRRGNVHENSKRACATSRSWKRAANLPNSRPRCTANARRFELSNSFVRMSQPDFFKTFDELKRAADRAHQAKDAHG